MSFSPEIEPTGEEISFLTQIMSNFGEITPEREADITEGAKELISALGPNFLTILQETTELSTEELKSVFQMVSKEWTPDCTQEEFDVLSDCMLARERMSRGKFT